MSWRVARAIQQLFDELNAAAPKRSKASDGTIGDAAHASRTSDHNPWVVDARGVGVVTAGDFTDDDAHAADMSKVVDYLTKVSHDSRIKYLIHRGRIYSSYATSGYPAWAARPYSGPNAHMHHLHVSVNPEPRHYDDADPWGIAKALKPAPAKPVLRRYLREGVSGNDVQAWQRVVKVKVDGDFGPATEKATKTWQRAHGLPADGIVGPASARKAGWTWSA